MGTFKFAALVIVITLTGCSNTDTPVTSSAPSGATSSNPSVSTIVLSATPATGQWNGLESCVNKGTATPAAAPTPATEGLEGVLDFGKLSQDHVQECSPFSMVPAVGGAHYPVWANCGFYMSGVPDMFGVHSMEHGAVWIAYDPGIGESELNAIRTATVQSTHVLASPYAGLKSKISLNAWSRTLSIDSTADPRFKKFMEIYVQGPQTPELGAACDHGIGTPVASYDKR